MTDRRPAHGTPSRIPLRGLAMILIAVAVILTAWGVYDRLAPTDETLTVGATSTAAAPSVAAQNTASAEPTISAPSTPAAPEPVIHVLNNSREQGLAQTAAERLGATGYVGNLSSTVLYENTVFYTDNEDAAQELAATVGGVALPRPDYLPVETEGPGALVVILTQDF